MITAKRAGDFATALNIELKLKGWAAGDLAAALWGTRVNLAGHVVPLGENAVRTWCTGKMFPALYCIRRVAVVLGVPPEALDPEAADPAD